MPKFELKTEVVEIEGHKFVLSQANFSMGMQLSKLEEKMQEKWKTPEGADPVLPSEQQIFDLFFYPKVAAAIVSQPVPTEDEMFEWPSDYFQLLYDAAERLNPSWFEGLKNLGNETPEELKNDSE